MGKNRRPVHEQPAPTLTAEQNERVTQQWREGLSRIRWQHLLASFRAHHAATV